MSESKSLRVKFFWVAAVVALVVVIARAQQGAHDATHSRTAEGSSIDQPVFVKYADAKWQKIVPELGDSGPEIAILRVDPKTGATQLLIRMNAAMAVPMHWHSSNETHTMIKGTTVFECGGSRETLGPGGFNYIPAKHQHRAWCSSGSLVFITVDGPWDINWISGAPTREHLGPAAVAGVLGTKAQSNEK